VPYRFTIRPLAEDEGGGYLIEFPDLPGCMSDGATIKEAITNGMDAMRGWIGTLWAEAHPTEMRFLGVPLSAPDQRASRTRALALVSGD
jgi:predicted RNase H-like HicB family nuclease